MTEVLIKAVTPFAEYDGLIYSYKVTCILNNGKELIFTDEKPFDLTESVDKKVVVTLATSFISENKECSDLFEGEIKYADLTNEYSFVSEYVTISISNEIVKFLNIKLNEKKEYCFEDFVLMNITESTI